MCYMLKLNGRLSGVLLASFFAVLLLGCGKSIDGSVILDGRPVKDVKVELVPIEKAKKYIDARKLAAKDELAGLEEEHDRLVGQRAEFISTYNQLATILNFSGGMIPYSTRSQGVAAAEASRGGIDRLESDIARKNYNMRKLKNSVDSGEYFFPEGLNYPEISTVTDERGYFSLPPNLDGEKVLVAKARGKTWYVNVSLESAKIQLNEKNAYPAQCEICDK